VATLVDHAQIALLERTVLAEILAQDNGTGIYPKRVMDRMKQYGLVATAKPMPLTQPRYHLEPVAQYLYKAWQASGDIDDRNKLVIYLQLVVYGRIAIVVERWPEQCVDVYQTIVASLIKALPGYKPKRGSLYTRTYTRSSWDSIGEMAKLRRHHEGTDQLEELHCCELFEECEVEPCQI